MRKLKEKVRKPKKPVHKRVWFWVVVIFLALVVISALSAGNSNPSESNKEITEETKQFAKEQDALLYDVLTSTNSKYDTFIGGIGNSTSLYEIYRSAGEFIDAIDYSLDYAEKFSANSNSQEYKDYSTKMQDYFYEMKIIAKHIQDYANENDMESLSKAEDGINNLFGYLAYVVTARNTYLESEGFSADEISEIVGSESETE